MKIGILALRVTIGGFFVGHGAQKLFGAQGGPGLKATAQFFDEGLGIKPGLAQAAVAGVAETAGGVGLVLGYHTPLAASTVVASMTTAIQKVHGKNGWNSQNGGFEYNAVLIAGAVAIAETGPGFLSLDALRGKQHKGLVWGAFALGAGVAGAFASHTASGYFGGGATPEAVTPATASETISDPPASVEAEPVGEPTTVEEAAAAAPADTHGVVESLGTETVAETLSVDEPVIDPSADLGN
jgi:putative oxidoreductase